MTYRYSIIIIIIIIIMWYRCTIIGGVKGGRGRYCTDQVLGFSINTVLQQHLHHLVLTVLAGPVEWCIANLWDDASA